MTLKAIWRGAKNLATTESVAVMDPPDDAPVPTDDTALLSDLDAKLSALDVELADITLKRQRRRTALTEVEDRQREAALMVERGQSRSGQFAADEARRTDL